MFDIGFSELMVIAVVALIVVGPERLPRVARMAGHLLGRLQRYVGDVKADINREIQLEELRKLQAELQASAQKVEAQVQQVGHDLQQLGHDSQQQLHSIAAADSAASNSAPTLNPPAVDAAPSLPHLTDSK